MYSFLELNKQSIKKQEIINENKKLYELQSNKELFKMRRFADIPSKIPIKLQEIQNKMIENRNNYVNNKDNLFVYTLV